MLVLLSDCVIHQLLNSEFKFKQSGKGSKSRNKKLKPKEAFEHTMSSTFEFQVEMTCEGCSGAVTRVLGRQNDVSKFNIDMEKQRVYVETTMTSDQVLEILKKTGKATTFIGKN